MGSKQFYIYSEGKNAEEAYQNAIREDQVRNGNKPYNGTIGSKEVHKHQIMEGGFILIIPKSCLDKRGHYRFSTRERMLDCVNGNNLH
jgi:hypothetical protein